MKFPVLRLFISGFSLRETLITLGVLILGLAITFLFVLYTRSNIERAARQDFEYSCKELKTRISTRLDEHAQLLRSGAALFAVSDSVTRGEWHEFYLRTRADVFLPGIQGYGYSKIIPRDKLLEHIRSIKESGYPDYKITPEGERQVYSTILYIEPFSEMNLRAFGYDMFSEPIRRKAMEIARDSNMSMLSGKVRLVQETGEDLQSGVLMYFPIYEKNMPVLTVQERRNAIKGWVYSPYRMKDLMTGIRGSIKRYNEAPLHLMIYDDTTITEDNLMYDNLQEDSIISRFKPNMYLKEPVNFNGKIWTLIFTARKDEMSFFHKSQVIVWITGLTISILLFILSMMQIRANIRTRQIVELNLQLERLNADKDRFMSILSHDLKSPFTSILGFLELLTTNIRKYSIDQIENHIYTINDAARNTYNLLEDLLMWTRAHSGNIPFNPQKIQFREIYESVAEILVPVAESKNIMVNYVGYENLSVYADKDMLKAIMRNLISNAIKFTSGGGSISISTSINPGNVTVSVSDTGIGISPERIQNLFDLTNIHSTAGTSGERGSGLGLILCREFVQKHGGKIWVTSEPGKGSDFRFTLPA